MLNISVAIVVWSVLGQTLPASNHFTPEEQADLYAAVLRLTEGTGTGTAVCIAYDEKKTTVFAVTAYHCVEGRSRLVGERYTVARPSVPVEVLQNGRVVAHSKLADLAIIAFPCSRPVPTCKVCPWCLTTNRFRGLSIGYAGGRMPALINHVDVEVDPNYRPLAGLPFAVNRYVVPGESGGPLFEPHGLLVGVAARTTDPATARGYYTDLATLHRLMADAGIDTSMPLPAPVTAFFLAVLKLVVLSGIVAFRRD